MNAKELKKLEARPGLNDWQKRFIAGCRKYWKKNGFLTDKQMSIIIEISNETTGNKETETPQD